MKSFQRALGQIAEVRGISPEVIIETLEAAIATAYKKDYGQKGQKIKAKFNPVSGDVKFWQVKLVVDESMLYTEEEIEALKEKKIMPSEDFDRVVEGQEAPKKVVYNPEKHVMLDEAKKKNLDIKLGEELEIPLVSKQDYGRIAAQTAKQVILQKIREAEKDVIASEYRSKEGEIISGIVQRIEGNTALIDIGKTLGILNKEEQIPGEFYRQGQRLKFYILKVQETPKGSVVLLSRAYPKLVSRLFELEVPEISSSIVVINSISREPGFRTKMAVSSTEERIDPIGSCVGQRGTRIMAVINELGGEKIDVIAFDKDPEKFITNALSPAKVAGVKIEDKNTAVVFVNEDQLSLAIGKDGRNVRLASNLTGWKIDVKANKPILQKNAETNAESSGNKDEKSEEEKPKRKIRKSKKTKEVEEALESKEEPPVESIDVAQDKEKVEEASTEGKPEETK
ncbi:MAG: transcription termination factor NusA [Candidatus Staskawiczbacteria bacterium RIFCSPHIGHO2_02_FULL_34_10]|uniref:Transcription termination/antitermination protein NusA n=2 Tax=Candidatus Staskawicziibacteriota TaxID=1817916 RepID=A0A1G2HL94_9BACT|nr:MAG: transcription termination factor NusA [Candidatus Staskawiczbacteria bacterium RIFCSPHIGHO2_01_FULL_34_27]OGZ66249.1 MAG: transcription termination factor NusA [Candidatus Staskawiczbacteria bacterium RIFCSPHIGHO2_02_FULL_34_10]